MAYKTIAEYFARIKEKSKEIHIRIFTVIIATAIVIIIFGNLVGTVFLTKSIAHTMEEDMLIAIDIADLYVTNEINLLKLTTANAAGEAAALIKSGQSQNVLELISARYPMYIGLAVFDETSLLYSWGKPSVAPELINEPFMKIALRGGQAVSTTMYAAGGSLVMYVSTPMGDGLVLAGILPGLYFSNIVSRFAFWQTGHLYIDDENGHIISNYRTEWIEQRMNFIEAAKANAEYESISALVTRGITGERAAGQFSLDGALRVYAFRPVSSPNENWFIGIIAPLAESPLKGIPGGVLLNGIIMFVLSVGAAILATSLLKHPYEEVDRLRKDAEMASLTKSTFLANVSHEIRTPMNSIMGFSELALDGEVSPKIKNYLDKIKTNADWLLQIINDILDISKVESGKIELENVPFDLHELFTSCRTLIMPKAIEKGLMLHFYAEPSIGKKPLGDPTRLRQVFVNLLSNAVKFTNTGMVKLHAAIKEKTEKTITMYFEVKDSGIGMIPEQIDRIFEPFVQGETGSTRRYGGTGLGLPITKNIVEMMGGKLSVESTLGVGSKFSFELTFDTIDVADEDLTAKKIIFNELEKPLFEGEILLCEDNALNQQVISEHLTRVGLKTVVADNGKTGVKLVQSRKEKGKKQFDLIFMDMHMPVMDGLEAAAKIHELNTGIPIVALTANIMSTDRDLYRKSGVNDCVGKPFTSQELWRCLLKYFQPVNWQKENENRQLQAENELRQKLISNFVKDNRNKFTEITDAISSGDIKLAHRLVHTLKGNAGQLGKIVLQKTAEDIEQQLKDGLSAGPEKHKFPSGKNLVTEEHLRTLETELNAVITEFTPLINESAQSGAGDQTGVFDEESARNLFNKLETMLEMGNPECRELISKLRLIPGLFAEAQGNGAQASTTQASTTQASTARGSTMSGSHLVVEEMIQQMDDLDFEPALVSLAELKKKLGMA